MLGLQAWTTTPNPPIILRASTEQLSCPSTQHSRSGRSRSVLWMKELYCNINKDMYTIHREALGICHGCHSWSSKVASDDQDSSHFLFLTQFSNDRTAPSKPTGNIHISWTLKLVLVFSALLMTLGRTSFCLNLWVHSLFFFCWSFVSFISHILSLLISPTLCICPHLKENWT